jgi:3-phosphoshikimate 1-carboxyvinyltransferase
VPDEKITQPMSAETMQVTVHPSSLGGSIQAPASKSSMQRACAAALLCKGESVIKNPGRSNDDQAAIGMIQALGAQISILEDGSLKIGSHGVDPNQELVNCGESGLGIRMFAPIAALSGKRITITGEGSLLNRPMNFFDEVMPALGVEVVSTEGRLPIELKGPLQPNNIEIDGSLSSQFLTGLLMAYSAKEAKDVTIRVNNLKSRPYIDLTLKVMSDFGLKVPENKKYQEFHFSSGLPAAPLSKIEYRVEGDWSGASFLLVCGAIAGKIIVRGLDIHSTQADRAVMQALSEAGAVMDIQKETIEVRPGNLKAFNFDATDCPDLFPPLVALASYCKGVSTIKGVKRLAHKESNRALTLQEEFRKMRVEIAWEEDIMHINGGNGVKGARVHSRHDHRIAMACAVAALKAEGDTVIQEAQAINKSYPDFYEHLQKLGANIQKQTIVNHL